MQTSTDSDTENRPPMDLFKAIFESSSSSSSSSEDEDDDGDEKGGGKETHETSSELMPSNQESSGKVI